MVVHVLLDTIFNSNIKKRYSPQNFRSRMRLGVGVFFLPLNFWNVLQVAKHVDLVGFKRREYARTLDFEKKLHNAPVNVSNGRLELEL